MELTEEQAGQIKEQLLKQTDNFPADKKDEIIEHIKSMSPSELEEFLKQNQAMAGEMQQCIFCSIAEGKTPSAKIDENSDNVAILELNPLSKGHTLIVPKKHLEKPEDSTKELANKVSEKIKAIFNPKNIKANETEIMGHALIEVIPIYDSKPKERSKTSETELKKLQKLLTQPIKEKPEPKPEKPKPIPKMKPRIP